MKVLQLRQLKSDTEKGDKVLIQELKRIDGKRCVVINNEPYIIENNLMKEWFEFVFITGTLDVFPTWMELGIKPNGAPFMEMLDDNGEQFTDQEIERIERLIRKKYNGDYDKDSMIFRRVSMLIAAKIIENEEKN